MGRRRFARAEACLLAGILVLSAALAPPLHALAEALFSAHMAQHLLLVVVAAPLLALASPGHLIRHLPRRARPTLGAWARSLRFLGQGLRSPVGAVSVWLAHAAVLWAWHLPALYDTALQRPWLHTLEHASLLGTAWLFWAVVLPPGRGALGVGGATIYLFTGAAQCAVLGALIAFAETPWYPAHRAGATGWRFTPIDDQQLAGLLMWLPGGVAYLGAAVGVVAGWLRIAERSSRERGDVAWPASHAGRRRRLLGTLRAVTLPAAIALAASACSPETPPVERSVLGGDPTRGAEALRAYGCGGCHMIPGVPGARGVVGPSLAGLARRPYLAGTLVNNAGNLVAWIRDPHAFAPRTVMPPLGVTDADARHIAAYLYQETK